MIKIMNKNELKKMILEITDAYKQGDNTLEIGRNKYSKDGKNSIFQILLAYDLQSGTYSKNKLENLEIFYDNYGKQLADILNFYSSPNSTFLEVGCGECTSMVSILKYLNKGYLNIYGFDISWSRIFEGKKVLNEQDSIELFVADLFSIPLVDDSIDVVYSSHSIEPNGGREKDALRELLRVASDKVILIEPIYELANSAQKERMNNHGYIKNLKSISKDFNVNILRYELLPVFSNPLNHSGVLVLEKKNKKPAIRNSYIWKCPITDKVMEKHDDLFFNKEIGIAYPILRNIPLLQSDHVIIASKLSEII